MVSLRRVGTRKGLYIPYFLLLGFLLQQTIHPTMNLAIINSIPNTWMCEHI